MKIAIVGATGLVGRNIIEQCEKILTDDIEFHLLRHLSSWSSLALLCRLQLCLPSQDHQPHR